MSESTAPRSTGPGSNGSRPSLSGSTVNLLLVLGIVATFAVALIVGLDRGDFGGADASATEQIATEHDYEPWFEPFWTQPGGEVESGLFALQAGIGAGILGFVLGTLRERRRHRRTDVGPETNSGNGTGSAVPSTDPAGTSTGPSAGPA